MTYIEHIRNILTSFTFILIVFVVDVFLFDPTASNGGNTGYKPLGKSGVTVIDKPGGTPKERSSTSNQKVLVLYRSKQETLAAAPIIGGKFIFDIQNETYGCFYTLGKTQQKVCLNFHKCIFKTLKFFID